MGIIKHEDMLQLHVDGISTRGRSVYSWWVYLISMWAIGLIRTMDDIISVDGIFSFDSLIICG